MGMGSASPELATPQEGAPTGGRPARLDSVDLVRGLVMVIMALDHVRDYFSDRLFLDPVDLKSTTPGIFFTRWITHYCAPVFIFLAGTGAFLSGTRGKSKGELAWFLLSRGLWLLLLELTVIKMSWAFHFDLYVHGGGVFWAIGWSMIVLAGLVFLPLSAIAVFGVLLVCCHNAFDGKTAEQLGLPSLLWLILHSPGELPVVGSVKFGTAYCLIPWAGVMALGYCLGALLRLEPVTRRRELFGLGGALILAFIFLRWINLYGDALPWDTKQEGIFALCSFLNCTKYPPSLLYLLMTLGPAIVAVAALEKVTGPVARFFITFGRVPLFFYLLHIPLIHGLAVAVDIARWGWSPLATNGPWVMFFDPRNVEGAGGFGQQILFFIWTGFLPGYGFSLPIVYLIWVGVVLLLYLPCRWFAGVKQRNRAAWLSYL